MTTVAITVDATSSVPPYEQIRGQLAERIQSRALPAGSRLPTVRALAGELGVAVNTVARAYRELEGAELVHTHGRAGTVVADHDPVHARMTTAARDYVDLARGAGLSANETLALVRRALDAP